MVSKSYCPYCRGAKVINQSINQLITFLKHSLISEHISIISNYQYEYQDIWYWTRPRYAWDTILHGSRDRRHNGSQNFHWWEFHWRFWWFATFALHRRITDTTKICQSHMSILPIKYIGIMGWTVHRFNASAPMTTMAMFNAEKIKKLQDKPDFLHQFVSNSNPLLASAILKSLPRDHLTPACKCCRYIF